MMLMMIYLQLQEGEYGKKRERWTRNETETEQAGTTAKPVLIDTNRDQIKRDSCDTYIPIKPTKVG